MEKGKITEIECQVMGKMENVFVCIYTCIWLKQCIDFINSKTVIVKNFSLKLSHSYNMHWTWFPASVWPNGRVHLWFRLTQVFLFLPPLQIELPGETEKSPKVSQLRLFTWPSFGDRILPTFKSSHVSSIKQIKVKDVNTVLGKASKLSKCIFNCGSK